MNGFIAAAIGGVMIGLASVALMGFLGRIAGVSVVVGSLLPPSPAVDRGWRIAFVAGLILGPALLGLATGRTGIGTPIAGMPVLVLAGLLVGVGTTLGNGCTSGHGVCGMARLSLRSIMATATFVVVAMITVFVVNHAFKGV